MPQLSKNSHPNGAAAPLLGGPAAIRLTFRDALLVTCVTKMTFRTSSRSQNGKHRDSSPHYRKLWTTLWCRRSAATPLTLLSGDNEPEDEVVKVHTAEVEVSCYISQARAFSS